MESIVQASDGMSISIDLNCARFETCSFPPLCCRDHDERVDTRRVELSRVHDITAMISSRRRRKLISSVPSSLLHQKTSLTLSDYLSFQPINSQNENKKRNRDSRGQFHLAATPRPQAPIKQDGIIRTRAQAQAIQEDIGIQCRSRAINPNGREEANTYRQSSRVRLRPLKDSRPSTYPRTRQKTPLRGTRSDRRMAIEIPHSETQRGKERSPVLLLRSAPVL
ncbi:uncharacterized protein B0J16DRAFT_348431 [Fusarium flagelliforme]|uniref:uncharacterized protein n=1 Tax=Fusarium flagelliforme TaxID=2675880 RepID=UPI001E8CEC82|nr:uncharacterized protein B0J16DRAFT_348431 [Fusarium flagelliforme]KAH7174322.1 hypothetical protein B0J16DRAFT_348431 [Fusarium flagelliforme]